MPDNFSAILRDINIFIRDVVIPSVCEIADNHGDSDRNDMLRITAELLETAASVNDYGKGR